MPRDLATLVGHLFPISHKFTGIEFIPTSVSSSPYTVVATDYILLVDTSSARTINLPSPAIRRIFYIADVTGSANTNNITLARNGSESIEGVAANRVLMTNWGFWTLFSDGTNWFVKS